jgi:hypothetical protein
LPTRNCGWRKYELCHGLIKAAEARGEKMTKDEAAYIVDKGLATGLLASAGGLNFTAKGYPAEEIAAQIIERWTAWGQPVDRADALRLAARKASERFARGGSGD